MHYREILEFLSESEIFSWRATGPESVRKHGVEWPQYGVITVWMVWMDSRCSLPATCSLFRLKKKTPEGRGDGGNMASGVESSTGKKRPLETSHGRCLGSARDGYRYCPVSEKESKWEITYFPIGNSCDCDCAFLNCRFERWIPK